MSDVEGCLLGVEAVLDDADVTLSTDVGGHREVTSARLWRGQVLVDWEPDAQAGGCLLRPGLLRRLIALHADVRHSADGMLLRASGRVVAALSSEHADLVRRLGGPRRVELEVRLGFADGHYRGGTETYTVLERGTAAVLLRLEADVRLRSARPASPHTLRAAM
jgi:hypothetical protein